jgi:hypothetical protein
MLCSKFRDLLRTRFTVAVTSYALGLQPSWGNGVLGLQQPWGNCDLVYSSREGTVAWFTTVVRKRRAWFTAVVRELWLDLQQSIDSQLSMLVIVLYLIRTGSNLYSWGGLFLSLKHKVAVCDHKNIACYQERTAITSPNRLWHEQHKKAAIWPENSGICRIFSGKYR